MSRTIVLLTAEPHPRIAVRSRSQQEAVVEGALHAVDPSRPDMTMHVILEAAARCGRWRRRPPTPSKRTSS